MFLHFKKINVKDYELSRVQDNVDDSFRRIEQDTFNSGNFISANIGTSDTIILHKLKRKPVGYIVVDKDAAADVYTSSTTNNLPELQLILKASASVNAKIYIF